MRIVSRINADGLFVEDVLLQEGEPLPAGTIENRPPEGFRKPRWNGATWVEAEPAAETLEKKKQEKIAEFGERALEDLLPVWTPHRGVEETLHAVIEYLIPMLEAQAIAVDQRLYTNRDIGRKALDKKKRVEAATTPEEVEAIVWNDPAPLESFPDPLGPRKPKKK